MDIRTLILADALLMATTTAIIFVLHRLRFTSHGAIAWFAGSSCITSGLLLLSVRGNMEAARPIRRRWGPKPPILALTASALKGDHERFLEAGMDAYLSKPVQVEQLLRVMTTLTGIEVSQPSKRPDASKPTAIADHVHLSKALELMGGHEDDFREFCMAVLDFLTAQRTTMLETLETDNLQAFIRMAHSLRSTALTFGHEKLASALKKAEEATTKAEAESILGPVQQGIEELVLELKAYLLD